MNWALIAWADYGAGGDAAPANDGRGDQRRRIEAPAQRAASSECIHACAPPRIVSFRRTQGGVSSICTTHLEFGS